MSLKIFRKRRRKSLIISSMILKGWKMKALLRINLFRNQLVISLRHQPLSLT
jgi:hypothetical protein